MKKIILLVCVLVLCIAVSGILPIHGEEKIYDSVVRLHVLANSDSEEDQALKLKVRDAVLSYTSPLVIDSESREEAESILRSELDGIREAAERVIDENGYDYPVEVTLDVEEYPTRNYESMSFPSGKYVSLRVLIGESKGKNWWCVLFPPLCLSAATEKNKNEEAFVAVGLTSDQYKIITETNEPKYKLRFKLLETIENTFN